PAADRLHRIVEGHAGADERPVHDLLEEGEDELDRLHQVRSGVLEQQVPLAQRLGDQREVEHLQIAQAAVHQLGGAGGGAGGPVMGLDQADGQATGGGVERGTGPVDPAADDEHVQGILRGGGAEPGEMLRAVRGCEGGPLLIGHLTAPSHRDLRFPSDGRRAPSAGRTAAGRGGRHRGPCVHPFASSVHERARLAFMTRDSRLEGLYSVARMYYEQGQTMEAIAGTLRVSRSTVSRMLRDAREAELVTISLRPPEAQRVEELARRSARQYGVAVRVVPSVPEDDQRERLRTV